MSSPTQGIAIREFARRSGLDPKQVRRGIESGRLVRLSDGNLDPESVGTDWRKVPKPRGDKSANVRASASSLAMEPDETPADAAERIVRDFGATMTIVEAERVKENYLALLRQLEYDIKAGLVVSISDVASEIGAEYAQIRTKLLAIPSERAPQLHRLKTVVEVQDMLHSLMVEVLEGLTRDGVTS